MYLISVCFCNFSSGARFTKDFLYISWGNAFSVAEELSSAIDVVGSVHLISNITGEVLAEFCKGELVYENTDVET